MVSNSSTTGAYRVSEHGFTLIEVMVVTTMLAILTTISFQRYQNYAEKATNAACLSEAKNYANAVATALHIPNGPVPLPPKNGACLSFGEAPITSFEDNITAIAKLPGGGNIICDMSGVAVCSLSPSP